MYRESYQRGLLTIFFSCGSKPLKIWETYTQDGYITKFLDEDIKSMVLEIGGTNVSTTYMVCPKGKVVLGITMPFLVMIVKNLKKYFSFEVTILDDTGTRRRFRVSNFQSTTQIAPLCTVMPIALSEGWNQIQFNLADFCRRAYQKQFVEVQKFKVNANIRIRRIYFADRILSEEELPAEYKLFIPLKPRAGAKGKAAVEPTGADEKKLGEELKKRDSKTASATKLVKTESKIQKTVEIKEEPPETVDVGTDAPGAEAETKAAEDAAAEAPAAEGGEPAEGEAPAEGAPDAAAGDEAAAAPAAEDKAAAPAAADEGAEPARQSSDATTQTNKVIIQEVPEETAPAEVAETKDAEGEAAPAE